MQGFAQSFDIQLAELYNAKVTMAPGLVTMAKYICESAPEHQDTLEQIVRLARMLDIAAPAQRTTATTIADPRYNLLNYIIRNTNCRTFKEMDADSLLFNKEKPFTCVGQIQQLFKDLAEKLTKNFVSQPEYV